MRPKDTEEAKRLARALTSFSRQKYELPGIDEKLARSVLVEQLIESKRRIEYFRVISTRKLWLETANPDSPYFDALKAAIIQNGRGQLEDASWLIFLFAHIGKNSDTAWKLIRDIYGKLGKGRWDWHTVANDLKGFQAWLRKNYAKLAEGKFGNHRKYETLKDSSTHGTAAVVSSYVELIHSYGSHDAFFDSALAESNGNEGQAFDILYERMRKVRRFGRIGSFDYLTTIGHVGVATIAPGRPYLVGATGPLYGAKLLFVGDSRSKMRATELEPKVIELGASLGLCMHVLEDALCNWQKSPTKFIAFRT